MTSPLILASTSVYRKRLLERLRLPFEAVAPETDETPHANESPIEIAQRLAQAKASSIQLARPEAIIIGSDQVCVLEDTVLGKPGSIPVAIQQLSASSGKTLRFYTGVCLLAPQQAASVRVVETAVKMRTLSDHEITRYIELDRPTDCAGSFKWESLGIALFERIEGTDPTALEGLPLITLCDMLRSAGLNPINTDITMN